MQFFVIFFLHNKFNYEFLINKKQILNIRFDIKINFFLLTILCIFFILNFFIKYYIKKEKIFIYFFCLLIIFTLSIIILIIRDSIFLFFVRWEILGVTSFLLICYYKNWFSLNNSLITIFSNRFGDFFCYY